LQKGFTERINCDILIKKLSIFSNVFMKLSALAFKQNRKLKIIFWCLLLLLAGAVFSVSVLAQNKNADLQTKLRTSFFVSKGVKFGNWAHSLFVKDDQSKIGWVSDIHADRFKRRDISSGLMFPRKYSDYLPKVFDDLQRRGVHTVVATGDNTNSGDDNYAKELARIADEKNMQVLWVKGNHDNEKVLKALHIKDNYYFFDQGDFRIVVLDDVEGDGGYQGSIDDVQLQWLKQALETEKQVIVAMHIPVFAQENLETVHEIKGGDFSGAGDLLERYQKLENILHSAGNVKMVISGHWHLPWHKEFDGTKYFGQAALTRTGYSGAYGIIDTKNMSVDYLFAK
jgi:predicted phosphodiesterase